MITEQFEFIKKMHDNLINHDTSSSPAWLDVPVYGSVSLPVIYGIEVKFYAGPDEKLKNEEAFPSEYLSLQPFMNQVHGLSNDKYTVRIRLYDDSLDVVLIGSDSELEETEDGEVKLFDKNIKFADNAAKNTLEYAILGLVQKAYKTAVQDRKDRNVAKATLLSNNISENFYSSN